MSTHKFIFFSDQVVTYCAAFSDTPIQDHTVSSLEVELNDLERCWRQLVRIYESEMTSEDPNYTKEVRESTHSKFSTSCRTYKECKAQILDLLQIERQKLSRSLPKDDIKAKPTEDATFSLKLPPCDTELFNGGYDKWPSFRDMFSAIYGKHPNLSPAQKLFHLGAITRGEANQIVKRFALTDDNFSLAWDALSHRYQNKRILINHQLRKIFDIESVSAEKSKSLRNFQYTINNCLSVLRTYNISVIYWDPLLVYWVSTKLPEETLTAWEHSIGNHKEMPSWDKLNDFISKRLDFLESISDIRKPASTSASTTQKAQTFHVKSDTTYRPCKLCRQHHALRMCQKLKSMPLSEKEKFVSDNKVCGNCLSYGHSVSNCQSDKLCRNCDQPHHTLLHHETGTAGSHGTKSVSTGPQSSQNHRDPRLQQQSFYIDAEYEEKPRTSGATFPDHAHVQSHFSKSGERTILPTALVDIVHLENQFTVRAFIDQGSQETFVSNRIINRLSIPTTKSFTKISGLGGAILENSTKICNITLKSRKSAFSVNTTAIVITNLNHLMPSAPTHVSDWNILNQLDLADPNFFKPSQIDMLIGSDIIPLILKSGIHRNISGSLLAQDSEFGWFVSGPSNSRAITAFATWATSTSLNEEVKRFWEIEEIPEKAKMSESDRWCGNFRLRKR